MKAIKKIVLSFFFLYSFNMIASKFNIIIPINIYTLFIIFILDVSGAFLLILLKVMFF